MKIAFFIFAVIWLFISLTVSIIKSNQKLSTVTRFYIIPLLMVIYDKAGKILLWLFEGFLFYYVVTTIVNWINN